MDDGRGVVLQRLPFVHDILGQILNFLPESHMQMYVNIQYPPRNHFGPSQKIYFRFMRSNFNADMSKARTSKDLIYFQRLFALMIRRAGSTFRPRFWSRAHCHRFL
jgi:hypothetical protein